MSKEIVMFAMSKFNDRKPNEYNDISGNFKEVCAHTNEAPLKYMIWKLRKEHKKIDTVYAFVSKEVEPELDRFKNLFTKENLEIKPVPMYDVNLSGSFKSISMMADILHQYDDTNENKLDKSNKEDKTITIHVDLTGGPRHSVMLMMALIQIVKFTGAKIGMVTYANILKNQHGLIEDTQELMNLFTLISGADKFVSFGDVSQIKEYFKNRENNSESLNKVLTAMENLSETIKVCGSYSSMTNTLDTLAKAIQEYQQFYEENKQNLSEQEVFFGKLLPTIRNEYQDIMPTEGKTATPVEIIKWCVKRSFLQQATVFYTEWLPDYLINNKLVEVRKWDIIQTCQEKKLPWSTWQVYFFRNYYTKEKEQKRSEVFKELLKYRKITTKLPQENLIKFANQYSEYVGQWRNKFSHANSDNSNKENNINIVNSLIESVDLIEIKK